MRGSCVGVSSLVPDTETRDEPATALFESPVGFFDSLSVGTACSLAWVRERGRPTIVGRRAVAGGREVQGSWLGARLARGRAGGEGESGSCGGSSRARGSEVGA